MNDNNSAPKTDWGNVLELIKKLKAQSKKEMILVKAGILPSTSHIEISMGKERLKANI